MASVFVGYGEGGLRAAFRLFACENLRENFLVVRIPELGRMPRPRGNPPSPVILWNHRVSGKSPKNLWGTISCGQNLDFKELSGWKFADEFQNGTNAGFAHRHGLDDHRAFGKVCTRSDVTRWLWK
jgi:hypothetical protein